MGLKKGKSLKCGFVRDGSVQQFKIGGSRKLKSKKISLKGGFVRDGSVQQFKIGGSYRPFNIKKNKLNNMFGNVGYEQTSEIPKIPNKKIEKKPNKKIKKKTKKKTLPVVNEMKQKGIVGYKELYNTINPNLKNKISMELLQSNSREYKKFISNSKFYNDEKELLAYLRRQIKQAEYHKQTRKRKKATKK